MQRGGNRYQVQAIVAEVTSQGMRINVLQQILNVRHCWCLAQLLFGCVHAKHFIEPKTELRSVSFASVWDCCRQ